LFNELSVHLNISIFRFYQVDGGYTAWEEWGECSLSCGGGRRTRHRQCTNPVPQHGGKDCSSLGPSTETEECNSNGCPGTYISPHVIFVPMV